MNYILDRIKEPSTWVGLISILAAVVTEFTPDHIDIIINKVVPYIKEIIAAVFTIYGVTKVVTPENQ